MPPNTVTAAETIIPGIDVMSDQTPPLPESIGPAPPPTALSMVSTSPFVRTTS